VVGGIVIAALCLAVALWLTVRTALRLPAVVVAVRRPPPLASASGPVTVTLEDWENGVWKVALADGPAFLVTADIARAFRTPVRYTVYYVERRPGNTLLAAEPTDRDPDHADRHRAWPRAGWVAANAAGQLVAAQRIRIVGESVGWGSVYLLLPVFVIVAGTAVPYISHHYAPERIVVGDGTDLRITLWIAAAVVGLWATATVWSVVARRRRSAIARRPHILTSTGQIGWLGGRYVIRGTRVRLSIPHRRHGIPEPGHYRLYWMRTPRPTLLSAEPLAAPDLA
jgi:hypothetical protein